MDCGVAYKGRKAYDPSQVFICEVIKYQALLNEEKQNALPESSGKDKARCESAPGEFSGIQSGY